MHGGHIQKFNIKENFFKHIVAMDSEKDISTELIMYSMYT